ncbi:hypothetical protein [Streptomyces rapamycinicus]|uniref:Uncharacterized protein n=2 Tax=Streptomyces rapamycinicus TaxID=1226757 RepID=A0A0A0NFY9_STRRN|nr:hypothetical protein [Streptomyces rapamycinicus]AGP56161.1 hypothetical protein M271_23235 [Streptomyces rapamycinicus NRRL 5491]MBB4783767.1 hypothetical protein [Streptomyces rapamycinicus]RLV80762.1 hypothetical protein D3C57_120295 [Streptomyces rapamycinicus NRRL 5491]UTO64124.1 hypothetical protein LJB45_18530 [Streptomyces rapamycinicus]UTP32079.1 hypothetical protein LIV37_23650 [Streptomyces rapamycinicus NRRL 5491]
MTAHRPGQWPVERPVPLEDPGKERRHTRERARFTLTLGAIRAALEEEPSERAIRAAAKRWHEAITAAADETAAKLRRTG